MTTKSRYCFNICFSQRTPYKFARLNNGRVSFSHLARPKTVSITPKRLRDVCFSDNLIWSNQTKRSYISLKPRKRSDSKPDIAKSRNIVIYPNNQIFYNTEINWDKNLQKIKSHGKMSSTINKATALCSKNMKKVDLKIVTVKKK